MADLTITSVRAVEIHEQMTGPADEAVARGNAVRLATATGLLTKANATGAAEARVRGVAIEAANVANMAITIVKKGILDVGDALAALTYDQDVYLSNTDGKLADAAGDTSVKVGYVVPGLSHTTPKKLLYIDL